MHSKRRRNKKSISRTKRESKRHRIKKRPLTEKKPLSTISASSPLDSSQRAKQKDIKKVTRQPITGWRLWLFRIAALTIIPTLLFLLLEVSLHIVDYGYSPDAIVKCKLRGKDSYCDNVKFGWRFFPRNIARELSAFVFPIDKPVGTYRIFVLGASAAKGNPDDAFCFGRILQVLLRQQYPGVNFEVITAATPAINSHVVLEIAKDCARHRPDLFIVYLGNNEVVGPYGPGTVFSRFSTSLPLIRFGIAIKATKLGQLLMNLFELVSPEGDRPAYWHGLGMFLEKQIRAEDKRLGSVYQHFESNLKDIRQTAREGGAKIIFCTVGSNLKDCPPLASLHQQSLTEAKEKKWDEIYQQGVKCELAGDYAGAVEHYLAATDIDDCYADLQFRMGRCCWAMSEYDKARDRYIRARELDTLRFRADTRINEIIRDVAGDLPGQTNGVYLVDAVKVFERNSPYETPGEELFYEHVHMNFKGNYLVASAIFKQVEKILPEQIKHYRTDERPSSTEAECARYLAYTDWDRYKIVEQLLNGYIKRAPFTNQLYHSEQVKKMERELKKLKDGLKPEYLKKAAVQYRFAIENNKEDWLLHQKYGKLLLEDLKDYRAAIEQYRLLLEYLDYYVAHANLAVLFVELGNLDAAFDHSLRAIQIKPTCADAHYSLALVYQHQGRIDKAVEYYSNAIRFAPDYLPAYDKLGAILYKQGKVDKAVELYRRGALLMPESALVHHNLGFLLGKQGRKQEAIKELRIALQIDPNFTQTRETLNELLNKRD